MNELLQGEFVRFASKAWFLLLTMLLFSRGMDFLSTYIATPNMVLEGNPVARKLGWRWGIPLNAVICVLLAFWPAPAIVLITVSLLVAARNFQNAWLMRTLGEHFYRDWHLDRLRETSASLYVFCLLGQTGLIAMVGIAVIYFSEQRLVPTAIGMGIIAYAVAILGFTLFSVWRLRRAYRYLDSDPDAP